MGILTVALTLAACSNSLHRAGRTTANRTGSADINPIAQTSAERLGTVHVIGTGQRFVLVQTPSNQSAADITDGQAFVCREGGTITATLRASHERRPPFIVADVVSGEPHLGDEVFIDAAPAHTAILDPSRRSSPVPATSPSPVSTPDFRANPVLPPAR